MTTNGTTARAIAIPEGMTRWQTLRVQIRGVTPLLMNNPAKMRAPNQSVGRKTIPTAEEEAETSVYRTDQGLLYVKADHVRESLKVGSTGARLGKKTARPIIAAAVTEHPIYPIFLLMRDGEPITDWEIDTRRCVVQRQGILRSRALIPTPWEFEAIFEFDQAVIPDAEAIVTFLGYAGQTAGLLDYRPSKGGSMGRFEVVAAFVE